MGRFFIGIIILSVALGRVLINFDLSASLRKRPRS